jgi:predicted HAD superfamily Cof-like phosphohydrolase
MRKNRRTLKGKLKDLASKTKRIIFGKESNLDIDKILNPPSWRERQVQNQKIEEDFEKNLKAKGKEAHWSDKYDKDFKKMEKEVVRVRENG